MRAVGMRAERVLRMPFTEMVVRCRQEAWKWVDRTVSAVRPAAGPARVRHPRAGMVLSRFFEGAAHAHATARMLASLPQGRRDDGLVKGGEEHAQHEAQEDEQDLAVGEVGLRLRELNP